VNGGGAGARGHGKNGVALQANVDSKDAVSVVGVLQVQRLRRLPRKRKTVAMGVLLILVVLLSLGEGGRCTAAAGSLGRPRLWRAASKLL
jgi:hypothetical protein